MKKVYIVSHSHWDREWYMPYEQHHMRLIELIDNLIYLFKNDPDYKFFHLDGQTIILDDYLKVRPENRQILKDLIKKGKLQVGPFYILQDDFLTTSESNTRNMLIGHEESKKWGGMPVRVGYFPDTFGNMGQTPQMMKQIGLETAMFGHGVKPTGFANLVTDDDQFSSHYSEMKWRGPDGSSILGILFANWYDNGKEIPTDLKKARKYWDERIKRTARFASTDDLLFLNGSDHEPVQMNLSEAIRVANKLYPDIKFIHANYNMYLEQLKQDLSNNLDEIQGEITSQETNGWTTLANTASSRIPIKQWNTKVSKQLENITEPLNVLLSQKLGQPYPHDQLRYAWKLLMQNHPHDSICACSVDEVIEEIMIRFKKSYEVGRYLSSEALEKITQNINTEVIPHTPQEIPFVIFNTSSSFKSGIVSVDIPIERRRFNPNKDNAKEIFSSLKNKQLANFVIKDKNNHEADGTIKSIETKFNYDLPKDEFRHAFVEKVATIEMLVTNMEPISWQTFKLTEKSVNKPEVIKIVKNNHMLENQYLKVNIEADGTLTVKDKKSQQVFKHLLIFEDTGDVGNEYVYKQSIDNQKLYSTQFDHTVQIVEDTTYKGVIKLVNKMMIPEAMDEQLLQEQQQHVDYRYRQAKRSTKCKTLKIETLVILEKNNQQIKFRTSFNNQMKDHRIRVIFNTSMLTKKHYADSIYEVVERPNQVDKKWVNPENPQHTHAFVNVHDEKKGITIANLGLNEYEVNRDGSAIKVTLLRSVGEMGDWGYFPAPEAQCLGEFTAEYALELHDGFEQSYLNSLHNAFAFQVPFSSLAAKWHTGQLQVKDRLPKEISLKTKITATKNVENSDDLLIRQYNLTNNPILFDNEVMNGHHYNSSLLEECQDKEENPLTLRPHEIHSTIWKV